MSKDNVLPSRNCFCAYVKTDIENIDDNFFRLVRDKDCTKELCTSNNCTSNYEKPIDDSFKKVAFQYAQDKEFLQLSPCKEDTQSKIYQNFYYELLIFIEIFRINIQCNYSL